MQLFNGNALDSAVWLISEIKVGLAKLFRLNLPQSLTITIESGIQNGTLAIVLATTVLERGDMALPAGVYSLVMFVSGGALMAYFGTRKPAPAAVAQSPTESSSG